MRPAPILKPARWQPLPGAEGMRIFPFFGKPDSTSSNLCLIDTGNEFILVDTGTNEKQLETVASLIWDVLGENKRPFIIFLTHCHIDHCYPLLSSSPLDALPLIVAAQEKGAEAMASGDITLTLGELFRKEVHPRTIQIPLLCQDDMGSKRERTLNVSGIGKVRLSWVEPAGGGTLCPASQEVYLPSGTMIPVFHTPGHTPDSICIQAGSILFCGDILFSTTPGVAGIAGFSRDDLLASIRGLSSLLGTGRVSIWYPGHGDPFDTPAMAAMLKKLEKEVLSLQDIHKFDISRLEESRDHAIDILVEAERLFAIIGGRLLALSFLLETLGEEAEAKRLRNMVDISATDSILCDFQQFCTDVCEGRRVELLLIMKAAQVLRKLSRALYCEDLPGVIDHSLVWRAERLLEEFLATTRDIPRDLTPDKVDIPSLLMSLVTIARSPPVSDEEFIDVADDPEAFRKALVARLAFLPPIPEISLEIKCGHEPVPPVQSDRFRLYDSLMALLEDLEAAGCRKARLGVGCKENNVELLIQAGCKAGQSCLPPGLIRRHERRFHLCGGDFSASPGGDRVTCTVLFKPAR